MADTSKQKSNNKFYFVLEEGEVSDIEDEDKNEKEEEKRKQEEFIQEFADSVRSNANQSNATDEGEMDLGSDTEEATNKIDTKPVALTVTFHDEVFAKRHRGVIESSLVFKYGPEFVDSNSSCIFVLHNEKSVDIVASDLTPSSAVSFTFHDELFSTNNKAYILEVCETLFGTSKVTSHGNWLIEVVQNEFLEFAVDTEPYSNNYLIYDKQETPKPAPKERRNGFSNQKCFNCLGTHSMRDCQKRKDYAAIAQNKKDFMKSKMTTRYHAEIDKYSSFAPGALSAELRSALGLENNQLPLHIYQMRKFGYPPGWLAEAKISHSGVTVYGKTGVVPEAGDEEGEVFEEGEKDLYDRKKLIAFPGFNTPVPDGTIDECEQLECPPISEDYSLDAMATKLKANTWQGYKKKAMISDDGFDNSPITSSIDSAVTKSSESCDSPLRSESSTSQSQPQTPIPAARQVSIDLGTPLLSSQSPFSKLPDRHKFSVDISDVCNFENLPDATGTYEKMVGSISKIREFVARNNQ